VRQMRVDGVRPSGGVAQTYGQRQEYLRERQIQGGRVRKDEVLISPEAKELLETGQITLDAHRAKIEALKQAYESGTYRVDAYRLAEKILPHLIGKGKEEAEPS